MRKEHQWMSAKVPSLEADSFFIKINCVAGAAYLSMPPADTCPPPTAMMCVCACVWLCTCSSFCVCVCVCVCVFQCYQTMRVLSDIAKGVWTNQRGIQTQNQHVPTGTKSFCCESEYKEGILFSWPVFTNEMPLFSDILNLALYLRRSTIIWTYNYWANLRKQVPEQ